MGKTIIDKIWDKHKVKSASDTVDVLFIDRHFIHEVTSPQAFTGLNQRGLKVFQPNRTTAVTDHNVPTKDQHLPITNALSRNQVETLVKNCDEHGIELYGIGHAKNGIVHVVGPENGLTQPGMTIVCGDSHTSTHGAFGALAFGIGTSQVEQVMASQCLLLSRPKTLRIEVNGELGKGVTAKDAVLFIIAKMGAEGATGHFIEFAGSVFRNFTMEERMTVCNMSIEMGAKGGLVGIDDTAIDYVCQRAEISEEKIAVWKSMNSDEDAEFDLEVKYDGSTIQPMVTTGTSPDTGIDITKSISNSVRNSEKGLSYMGFNEEDQMLGKKIDYVFIGSCTNSRIEDLREVANLITGKKKAKDVVVWVVPGSNEVRKQA
ncbi:MAG: 3-isopropylmalate dehydratase large subunit, partial [Crocinitomicaceae bacterium]|nr:3-isopropylmalate dehydratase large subunit [Crocinitomicaceae bacterium]